MVEDGCGPGVGRAKGGRIQGGHAPGAVYQHHMTRQVGTRERIDKASEYRHKWQIK